MKKLTLIFILLAVLTTYTNADLIITGIIDTRIWRESSSTPGSWSAIKVPTIEVYVNGTYDFTNQGPLDLAVATNGGGWVGKGTTSVGSGVPTVLTDTFFYVIGTASSYNDTWGDLGGIFANISTTESALNVSAGSGNDGYRIGTAQVYDDDATVVFQHSWMYRKNGTGMGESFEWHPEDWIFGGNDALLVDRPETENFMYAEELRAAVPLGTYQVPEPATMVLISLGGFLAAKRKK